MADMTKAKIFSGILIVATSSVNSVIAGNIDWSTAAIAPSSEASLKASGLKYAPTPDVLYNVDLIFNEETLSFEPDMSTLTTIDNSKYAEADLIRGGLLYDKWWKINEESEPTETHTWYPVESSQNGSTTWRCKECHGWDYQGRDGVYESGSHYTGISGLYQMRNKSIAEIYDGIAQKNLPLSEQDVWDLTKFLKEGLIDMNKYIVFYGSLRKSVSGDAEKGRTLYEGAGGCSNCHGADGNKIASVSVGDVSRDNPWEGLHKIRFGQPGTKMTSAIKKELSLPEQIDLLTYTQTLSAAD